MRLSINVLIVLALFLFYIAFVLVMRTLINKLSSLDELYRRHHKRLSFVLSMMKDQVRGTTENISEIKAIRENLILDKSVVSYNSPEMQQLVDEEIVKLSARSVTRRKEACAYLGLIGSDKARHALESRLSKEKNHSVKLYISNALTDIRHEASLPFMIDEILGAHKWYREKAIHNILEYGHAFHEHFFRLKDSKDIEHIELLISYAGVSYSKDTKLYLFNFVDQYDILKDQLKAYYQFKNEKGSANYRVSYVDYDMAVLLEKVCRILSNYYYQDFSQVGYYTHSNEIIQRNAFWALSKINATSNFKILMSYIGEASHKKTIISVLTRMIEVNPRFMYLLEEAFENNESEVVRARLSQVLSNKIEYYISQLNTKNSNRSEKIIIEIIKNNKINELIGFLNVNKDLDIENRLLEIIRQHVAPDSVAGREFRIYLAPHLVEKLHMTILKHDEGSCIHTKDPAFVIRVIIFILVCSLSLPVFFIIKYYDLYKAGAYRVLLKEFVISFNYVLAYYSIMINSVYLSLLGLSYKNVRKQGRLWKIKNISMMFRDGIMPSISIIAPAHNEEKTVVESARSLLNLNYPDYEVIIVNDGSTDDTLLHLITEFNLLRVDYQYKNNIETAPIQGIYRNPSFPRMVVVDKGNGGKADALNAGINVANKTYFCGIDSDSLLEPDALLKIASLTLDESVETPALGGNIFPLNGCKVDKGLVTEINIPKSHLARFQTIEYVRAFMAGRLGWQELNSLLIISGAFGLFRKDRIIDIGGYMTAKSQYHKDTVGEDMELIVRITRLMHEAGRPFKVLYAFNANCWTEVPEDLKSLKTQRYRWHRGLIDIMYYHKKMFFNKQYNRIGFVAMPYYLIFEAIGPMIEFQGYIMVVLAFILGILDKNIAILLFVSTVLMGIIVSLSALLIGEREANYLKLRDSMKLLLYAIFENFGPRQLFSFWRIRALFNIVFGQGGWGDIKRRGVNR